MPGLVSTSATALDLDITLTCPVKELASSAEGQVLEEKARTIKVGSAAA